MSIIFQQQFYGELLRSEKRRTLILIAIFLFGMLTQFTNMLIGNEYKNYDNDVLSFKATWVFPVFIVLFELMYLIYLNLKLRKLSGQIPLWVRYFIVAIEIFLLTAIMIAVAKQHPRFDVLQSPAMYIFFIFIILSTLRLNFGLSFFAGLLTALSYLMISLTIYHHFSVSDSLKLVAIICGGTASGLVAIQIKKGINNSLEQSEKRHRIASLFSQQISKEVADKMMENNGKLESKRMDITIMFIDIRNFTRFTMGKTPEEIVQYQNAFLSIVINIIIKHNGIVNQILGDGCMATFGAPVASGNHSQNAVDAGLELLSAIDIAIKEGKLPATRIGIGVHTGEAVTGNIGTAERKQYSITGSIVILASRIEQLNKEFQSQFLVSEDVMNSLDKQLINAQLYGPVSVKGFDKEVSIYKLV
jgi:adenylate cyclase